MAGLADSATGDLSGMRALVVDDDATNRRVLELILESRGVASAMAANGREAVDAFENERFDLVLMDLQMPVMNGYDAIREIRALETTRNAPRTPVLVVSAYTRSNDREQARIAGADRHLGKPLNVPSLLGAISEVTAG